MGLQWAQFYWCTVQAPSGVGRSTCGRRVTTRWQRGFRSAHDLPSPLPLLTPTGYYKAITEVTDVAPDGSKKTYTVCEYGTLDILTGVCKWCVACTRVYEQAVCTSFVSVEPGRQGGSPGTVALLALPAVATGRLAAHPAW